MIAQHINYLWTISSIKSTLIPCPTIPFDKVLEEGIAEALGPNAPVNDDALSPSSAAEHANPNSESKGTKDLALDDTVLTLGVSLGGEDERVLHYYAGQVRYGRLLPRDRPISLKQLKRGGGRFGQSTLGATVAPM